jgi:hypothetical protein
VRGSWQKRSRLPGTYGAIQRLEVPLLLGLTLQFTDKLMNVQCVGTKVMAICKKRIDVLEVQDRLFPEMRYERVKPDGVSSDVLMIWQAK